MRTRILLASGIALTVPVLVFGSIALLRPPETLDVTPVLRQHLTRAHNTIISDSLRRGDAQPPRNGSLIADLSIPKLQFSAKIIEGDNAADLKQAPGHIPHTAYPGFAGNVGIAAHRDTYFRPLQFIGPGDRISLTTLHGTYEYRVVSTTIVTPDDTRLLYPTGHDTLTLVTCYPFYYVGSAPKRFIVRAEPYGI
jgi:LPXTG-site transpeptidase (sortase) family protein